MTHLKPTPDERQAYETSRRGTLMALEKIDDSTLLNLTRLTLPEIRALRQEIAQVLPVGNLPAFILDGLTKLKGRLVSATRIKRDLGALFQGTNIVPQGLYGAFIAGPATVLYAYQKLLQLAGKDLETAFPEGTWQFYLQFGLREDAARHTCETIGFDRAIPQANTINAAAAWIWAIADFCLEYDDLVTTDWNERVSMRLLLEIAAGAELADSAPLDTLLADWNVQRPYAGPTQSGQGAYLNYRRGLFNTFLQERLTVLPNNMQKDFQERLQERTQAELANYQNQMTLFAALEPDRFQDIRQAIPVWCAQIGFVWRGRVYLIPLCEHDAQGNPLCYQSSHSDASPFPLYIVGKANGLVDPNDQAVNVNRWGRVWAKGNKRLLGKLRPISPKQIKGLLMSIMNNAVQPESEQGIPLDLLLVNVPRSMQKELRDKLPEPTLSKIARLRQSPIILNWDIPADSTADAPLAYIRRGQRGIGDHALTIFRTQQGFVFDQSHIFFDGLWGMATAEILTNKAIQRYHQVVKSAPATPAQVPRPLDLSATPQIVELAREKRFPSEAAAQDTGVDTQALAHLRRWLNQRGVRLTVNDLLLLYRFFHACDYAPSPQASQAIESFGASAVRFNAKAAVHAITENLTQLQATNPAMLIPMDASNVSPRERIFPTTFRNPLVEIHHHLSASRQARLTQQSQTNAANWAIFDQSRRELLTYLKTFGDLLHTLKAVTMRGESFNTATIRLLAHLPASMQHLLDQIPQRIGVLNEIVKGSEVFSNVGQVAPGSSLSRFCSARDDGQTKWLVWGVLTDDKQVMHISLRNFCPFVSLLLKLKDANAQSLADILTRDYLHSYVQGFNRFIADLSAIVREEKPDG